MLENRKVVAVAYDGLCAFEFGIATELFGLDRPELGVPWYEYRAVAASREPMRALGGITISATHDLRYIRQAGTIVLPGWKSKDVEPPPELLRAIRTAHSKGARVMSICSGVYVLAATGLLDGQPATTHWRYVEHLAEKYPSIDVQPNVLYIDNGQTLTSAGSAAGIDLGLHLIRRDFGSTIAGEVARRLVVPPQREGGQAQFIRYPTPSTAVLESNAACEGAIASTKTWVLANLHRELTVSVMAKYAHMSTRTFARRFVGETGTTPLAWVLTQRLRYSQQLLETTAKSLDQIATASGFASLETMRHHFRHALGTSPSRYRSTFGTLT
jgi:AraC family transcriptional regulator, transcriptional activator FtrA